MSFLICYVIFGFSNVCLFLKKKKKKKKKVAELNSDQILS